LAGVQFIQVVDTCFLEWHRNGEFGERLNAGLQQFLGARRVFGGGFARVVRIDVLESKLFTIIDAVRLREFAGPVDNGDFFISFP
jgi:hypothetical protein